MADEGGARPAVIAPLRVRPTLGSTLLVIAAIGLSVIVIDVFSAARRTIGWAFAAVAVAWLLSGVIATFERRVRRGIAVTLTMLLMVALVVGTWVGVMASLRSEVSHIRTSLPNAAVQLEHRYDAAARFRLSERVASFLDQLDERFSTRAAVSKTAGTAPAYFVSGVLLLFLLAYGPRFCQGALRQIRDDDRRAATAAVISGASTRARRYTLTTLLHVMIVVVLASGTFYALDLPAPFVVGLLFGAVGAIPFLGFVLGGIPALLLAVADGDVLVIVVVAAFVIGAQSVEALVIRPRVDARTVRLGPALAMIVALLGFELYGVGGAAYALIALVFVLAALDEWTRWNARDRDTAIT